MTDSRREVSRHLALHQLSFADILVSYRLPETAYETMYTLVSRLWAAPHPPSSSLLTRSAFLLPQLDTCLSKIDIPTYLARVVAGLSDSDEIKGQYRSSRVSIAAKY